jgi:hypothetical protein
MTLTITNPLRFLSGMAFCLLFLVLPCARAQYTPPPPPLTPGPCVPTKKDPCTPLPSATAPPAAADKFPFPGEPGADEKPSAPASPKAFPFPEDADKPAAPSAQTPAAKSFPFPEDADKAAVPASSSSSGAPDPEPPADADDAPALADKGSSGSTRAERRRHLPKVEDLDEREAKDLEVAHYYTTTGNFLAAYNRAKDAVTTIPDDPAAHFALAEGARNLKKNDEAIAEYKLYLKLDPGGEKAKSAQRALSELSPK